MRLCLGTVQFGLPYGVANKSGQVSAAAIGAMLGVARAAGVDMLDTAVAYGSSERVLGEVGVRDWKVVTKLPPFDGAADPGLWVRDQVESSLGRLRIARLHGLLLHRSSDLLGAHGPAIREAMIEMRERGLVHRLGVSIYDPRELDELDGIFTPGLVQAPFNVLDRRIASSGWLARLHSQGVEVHTRSAFLQGLLLMPSAERPAHFARWSALWCEWDRWLQTTGRSAVEACLGFVSSHAEVDRIVVGVDGIAQLRELIAAATRHASPAPEELRSDDLELLNPSRWPPRPVSTARPS